MAESDNSVACSFDASLQHSPTPHRRAEAGSSTACSFDGSAVTVSEDGSVAERWRVLLARFWSGWRVVASCHRLKDRSRG